MEVRSDFVGTSMSATGKVNSVGSGSRRSKKRTSRRNNASEAENRCRDEEEVMSNRNQGQQIPSLDYRHVFWQRSGIPSHLQHHNGQQQQQQQRLFAAVSDPSVCGYSAVPMAYTMEPLSVPPIYPLYQPITRPNYRNYRVRAGRNLGQNNRAAALAANAAAASRNNGYPITNGYSSLQDNTTNYSNHMPAIYQNGDYASLPPSGNNDNIEDGEEINSEHRRYSDPGLGPAGNLPPTANSGDDSDSAESTGSSITTIGKNNKLVLSLVEQMTALRETNSQMFKELHEAKSDLENVKSELARLKHSASSDYQPGMLSDIVREMREANKILDEAMITKVNAMIDDHNRQRIIEFEKLREQLRKVSEEQENSYRRISKLEEEITSLKLNTKHEDREIAAFEEETITLRRDLQEARASRNIAENHASKCVNASAQVKPVKIEKKCKTSIPVRNETRGVSRSSRSHVHTTNIADNNSENVRDTNSSQSSINSSPSESSRNEDNYETTSVGDGGSCVVDEDWLWSRANISETENELPIEFNKSEKPTTTKSTMNSAEDIKTIQESHENSSETAERLIIYPKKFEGLSTTGQASIFAMKYQDSTRGFTKFSSETNEFSYEHVGSSEVKFLAKTPDIVDERTRNEKLFEKNVTTNIDCKKKKRKHGMIRDVPDVIVVAGNNSIVPKDLLCSTSTILTSRVLTAPSRATYTTAFI